MHIRALSNSPGASAKISVGGFWGKILTRQGRPVWGNFQNVKHFKSSKFRGNFRTCKFFL